MSQRALKQLSLLSSLRLCRSLRCCLLPPPQFLLLLPLKLFEFLRFSEGGTISNEIRTANSSYALF